MTGKTLATFHLSTKQGHRSMCDRCVTMLQKNIRSLGKNMDGRILFGKDKANSSAKEAACRVVTFCPFSKPQYTQVDSFQILQTALAHSHMQSYKSSALHKEHYQSNRTPFSLAKSANVWPDIFLRLLKRRQYALSTSS